MLLHHSCSSPTTLAKNSGFIKGFIFLFNLKINMLAHPHAKRYLLSLYLKNYSESTDETNLCFRNITQYRHTYMKSCPVQVELDE